MSFIIFIPLLKTIKNIGDKRWYQHVERFCHKPNCGSETQQEAPSTTVPERGISDR